jgi:predicted secreted protein
MPETGRALSVAPGVAFEVRLGSAPGSSGYEWQPAALPEGIRLTGSAFTPAGGAPGKPGDGGLQGFRLVAERPGRFTLRFVLKRRWESAPIETREIEVESR